MAAGALLCVKTLKGVAVGALRGGCEIAPLVDLGLRDPAVAIGGDGGPSDTGGTLPSRQAAGEGPLRWTERAVRSRCRRCPTRWYGSGVPTAHRRIQVTEDPGLAHALHSAAPFLPKGLSRAGQVRELALVGARQLADRDAGDPDRAVVLRRLAERFRDPASAGIDWDALREGKRRAWRAD